MSWEEVKPEIRMEMHNFLEAAARPMHTLFARRLQCKKVEGYCILDETQFCDPDMHNNNNMVIHLHSSFPQPAGLDVILPPQNILNVEHGPPEQLHAPLIDEIAN